MIYHREIVAEDFVVVLEEKKLNPFYEYLTKKIVVKVCEHDKPFFDVRSASFLTLFFYSTPQ